MFSTFVVLKIKKINLLLNLLNLLPYLVYIKNQNIKSINIYIFKCVFRFIPFTFKMFKI